MSRLRYSSDLSGVVFWYMTSICSSERPLVYGELCECQTTNCMPPYGTYLRNAEVGEDYAAEAGGTPDEKHFRLQTSGAWRNIDEEWG